MDNAPEIISKEPLGPVVRQGDDQWMDIVTWALHAMINAEELGIDLLSNVDAMRADSPNPSVAIVGSEGETGPSLGLSQDWALSSY